MSYVLRMAVGACVCLSIAAGASAGPYHYQVIDPDSDVDYGPFVTNDGAVIWSGFTKIGEQWQTGIFRWNDGHTTRLVPQGGTFSGFSALAVSDNGTIAFTASTSGFGTGAYRFDENGITEIATPAMGVVDAYVQDVNDLGEVLYTARTDPMSIIPTEVCVGTGITERKLAEVALPGFLVGGTINNHGAVAYSISTSAMSGDIWMFDPDGVGTIVDVPDGFGSGAPAINDAGDLAVITVLNGQGVWLVSGGVAQDLTNDPMKTYYADLIPTLNNHGQIVALSDAGIEVAPAPSEVVFARGFPPMQLGDDYLSATGGYGFGRSINDHGQVVANLNYTDAGGFLLNREAIVLATPIPEPASMTLLLFGLAGLLRTARMKRRACGSAATR